MIESLKEIYTKNLESLKKEIALYNNEADLWKIETGILNSAGNLTLHLIGNLHFFIGTQLGNTGFVRDRDREFSDKDIPKAELTANIDKTIQMLDNTFSKLNDADLVELYPLKNFGEDRTNGFILNFLLAHFNYHLGQINYHRRLLTMNKQ